MSSQLLSVNDGAGGEVSGGDRVTERQESEEAVVESTHNGMTAAEEENVASDSELDGEEEVLYDTSTSHDQLESSSGSYGSERTWQERCVVIITL